jgi:tetratricopeptide (TPR) repeat protein
MDEAVPHLLKAVEHMPQDPAARTNLVLALSMAGRAQEAIPHAQQAVALSGGRNPLILDLLGRLYAQTGRLPEAIEATRQALEVATQANDQQLARDLRARLSSYEAAAVGR